MYVQSDGRPDGAQGSTYQGPTDRPEAQAKPRNKIQIIIQSIIRKTDTSAQEGVKSTQLFIFDGEYHRSDDGQLRQYLTTYSVGTTHIPCFGEKEGVRNSFDVTDFLHKSEVLNFWMTGETASAVRFLPNINYKMYFVIDQKNKIFTISGSNDGYPSFVAFIKDGDSAMKKIYDCQQGYLTELFGSGGSKDVKISESGSY